MEGQLFFASTDSFVDYFKKSTTLSDTIQIDFTNSRIWDDSGVGALFKVKDLLSERGLQVELIGLDSYSKKMIAQIDALSTH